MKIVNVTVGNVSQLNTRCSLGWTDQASGHRYHIWTDIKTKAIETGNFARHGVLYKNPPSGIGHREPGYFKTRHLDPRAKLNAEMIAEAFRVASEGMLWTKALEELAEKEAQRERDHVAAVVLRRKHDAGPQLYDALLKALEAMKRARPNFRTEVDKLLEEAERIGVDAIHAANTDNEANRSN